jgi:hypothetical protein
LPAPPPSWGQRPSSLTVSGVATTAARTEGTTEETDETIGAIAAERYVKRVSCLINPAKRPHDDLCNHRECGSPNCTHK